MSHGKRWSQGRVWPFGLGLVVMLGMALAVPNASARRRRRRRKARKAREAKEKPKASAAIKRLAGPFKWGMTPNKVISILRKRVRAKYLPKIRKTSSKMRQDRLRRELAAEVRKIKRSYVKFGGKHTSWQSSIVDDQFEKRNNESMLVVMEEDQQRFFFFYHTKLYKQMIAFNSDHPKYKGLTFPKFVQILMKVYGQGRPVFEPDAAGINKLHHVEWIGPDNYKLHAIDKSGVYGNFCLLLIDSKMEANVERGRKAVRSMRTQEPELDPLIESVTKPEEEEEEIEDESETK